MERELSRLQEAISSKLITNNRVARYLEQYHQSRLSNFRRSPR
jgi:hypothetical protein